MPLRPSLRLAIDGLTHPNWLVRTFLRTLVREIPHFENMDAFRGPPILSRSLVRRRSRPAQLGPRRSNSVPMEGNLVLKGILSAADAKRARDCGADGIIISNHGGRQLDGAASPVSLLPEIAAEVDDVVLMVDWQSRDQTFGRRDRSIDRDMAMLGVRNLAELGRWAVMEKDA